jgi:hypothetical protein
VRALSPPTRAPRRPRHCEAAVGSETNRRILRARSPRPGAAGMARAWRFVAPHGKPSSPVPARRCRARGRIAPPVSFPPTHRRPNGGHHHGGAQNPR